MERLDTTSAAYSMEIRADKTKQVINNADGINTDIRVSGEKLRRSAALNTLGQLS